MSDPSLFPYIDLAIRVIGVLGLCVLPALIPRPAACSRVVQRLRTRWSARRVRPLPLNAD